MCLGSRLCRRRHAVAGRNRRWPALLQVHVDTYTNVLPKIAFGHPITEMEPFVTALEHEGT
jgi:acetolactate synthase-1/2/3 large subunit